MGTQILVSTLFFLLLFCIESPFQDDKNDSGLPVFIPNENDLIQSHGEMCSQIEIIQLIDGNNFTF